MKPTKALFLIAAACLPALSHANSSIAANGVTGGQFLKLGAGARAAAMGESYTAVADDATAVAYNPAAMTRIESGSLCLMHVTGLQDTSQEYGAFAARLGAHSAFGLSEAYLKYGNVSKSDPAFAPAYLDSPADWAITGAYAWEPQGLAPSLAGASAGVSLTYIQSMLIGYQTSLTSSAGLLSRPYGPAAARLSVVADRLFGALPISQAKNPLPVAFRFGGAVSPLPGFTATAELTTPRNGRARESLGAEVVLGSGEGFRIALRAGHALESRSDTSAGLGVAAKAFNVDYAFVPSGDQGTAHSVSLSVRFGPATDATD